MLNGNPEWRMAPVNSPVDMRRSGDLDWNRLSKLEIGQRILPREVFEAYSSPGNIENDLRLVGEQEKHLVG